MKSTIFAMSTLMVLLCGCGTQGRSMVSPGVSFSQYKMVTIYDSESAGFIELELERMFLNLGFKVVGEKEVVDAVPAVGVRYTERVIPDVAWGGIIVYLTITLEDMRTDKTLASVSSESKNRESAWQEVHRRLRMIIQKNNEIRQ